MSEQQTTCPVCGTVCEMVDIRKVNRAINLAYECGGCKLQFTIASSANAYEMAQRINQLERNGYGVRSK